MTPKSLDEKLARVAADPNCGEFIIADAKDADMAFGVSGLGRRGADDDGPRSLDEFRQCIREVVEQGLVDIMLMSVSTSDQLAVRDRLFAGSRVTPAIRANDTTDIWLAGTKAAYAGHPALPFRTASLRHAMFGRETTEVGQTVVGAELGLFSVTLNHDAERDVRMLEAYAEFRREAELLGFRHFLEVFAPNAPHDLRPEDIPRFVNDSIARMLAGVARSGRPIFLKIPYFGPAAMESLASYDSSLVVGILGGSAGTTLDAYQLLADAKRYGAKAALFGRRINQAEHQLEFIRQLRAVADGGATPVEGVRAYHGALARLKIAPRRRLEDDLAITPTQHAYAAAAKVAGM
jgi:hypothetical protein